MAVRADPRGSLLGFTPFFPLSTVLMFLSAGYLVTATADGNDNIALPIAVFVAAWFMMVVLGRKGSTVRVRLQEITREQFEARTIAAVNGIPSTGWLHDPKHLDAIFELRAGVFDVLQAPRMLGWLVDSGIGALLSIGLLVWIQPELLVVGLGAIPVAILIRKSTQIADRARVALSEPSRRAAHLYEIATSPAYAREVRVGDTGSELVARFNDESAAINRAATRGELQGALLQTVAWALAILAFGFGLQSLLDGVRNGDVSPGELFIAFGVMTAIVAQIGGAANGVVSLRRVIGIIEHLVDLEALGRNERLADDARATSIPDKPACGLVLRGVSFAYPGADRNAVDGLDLELPLGATVAVVGENGAGKSTLVKLLLGLHRPTVGEMTYGGVDLSQVSDKAWRPATSACLQEYLRIELALQESVGIGCLSRLDDQEAVRDALTRAGAHDVLDRVDGNLNAMLGTRLGGVELSGGQWQKVAVARALMRDDVALLTLDEPTSAIDPLAEEALLRTFMRAARDLGATNSTITVIVSHRFSTARFADLVAVMADGKVVEFGNHDALMAASGLYSELYNLQAKHYE